MAQAAEQRATADEHTNDAALDAEPSLIIIIMAARSSLSLALVLLLLLVVAVVAVGGSVEWRQPQASFSPGDPRVRYVGRVEQIHTPLPLVAFDWSSTGLQFLVTNTSRYLAVPARECGSVSVSVCL